MQQQSEHVNFPFGFHYCSWRVHLESPSEFLCEQAEEAPSKQLEFIDAWHEAGNSDEESCWQKIHGTAAKFLSASQSKARAVDTIHTCKPASPHDIQGKHCRPDSNCLHASMTEVTHTCIVLSDAASGSERPSAVASAGVLPYTGGCHRHPPGQPFAACLISAVLL